ncbi:MAG: trypsin-like peptidase domain-containing protein [Methylobacteriaceae bacterium]|nr:trypsin-like peptidase domain-containing protein [Methylobacteriaceae bacterium]
MRVWRALFVAIFASLSLSSAVSSAQPESFADLVARVAPSVVNISIKGMGQAQTMSGDGKNVSYAPHIIDLVGSGVIADPSGIIVTNRHVIDNAYEITVTLSDRTAVQARLLGKGQTFDLAILKIDVDHPLPAIRVGDSDKVRVGDRVIAIGNPLGLSSTVTSGIVSALHRDLSGTPYDEFIQTDAAINHGNSGGPLFNMNGEVIGINNQIFSDSPSSGSIGLGFAIPSNDLRFLVEQIRDYGRPHLGWLGMRIQTLTTEMADALALPPSSGAIVAEVTPGGPAAEAGIRIGDVIEGYNNQRINDYRTLNRLIAMAIGRTLQLRVWRNGANVTANVTVKEWPQELWIAYTSEMTRPPLFTKIRDFGFDVVDPSPDLKMKYMMDSDPTGPIVTNVVDDTAASGAKFRPGDVILKVQLDDVHTVAELEKKLLDRCNGGHRNALVFAKSASGKPRWVTLPLRL